MTNRVDVEVRTAAKSFRDLVVWQRAIDLTTALYQLTRQLPRGKLGFGDPCEIAEAAKLADETSKLLWSIAKHL